MKKLAFLFTIVCILFIGINVYAAPEEISPDMEGTVNDLIILSDFMDGTDSVSTFDTPYIISGSGQEGVTVTLYIYNEELSLYQKIKIKQVIENVASDQAEGETSVQTEESKTVEYDLSFDVGASGLFMTDIDLNDGENKIALYAEKDDEDMYQIEKISINKLDKSFKTFIENLTVDIKTELNKLIGGEESK
jgi:hypothetical protein